MDSAALGDVTNAWLEIAVTTVPINAEQIHGLLDTLGCIGTAQNFESDNTV